jgi:hypothetical protein
MVVAPLSPCRMPLFVAIQSMRRAGKYPRRPRVIHHGDWDHELLCNGIMQRKNAIITATRLCFVILELRN